MVDHVDVLSEVHRPRHGEHCDRRHRDRPRRQDALVYGRDLYSRHDAIDVSVGRADEARVVGVGRQVGDFIL